METVKMEWKTIEYGKETRIPSLIEETVQRPFIYITKSKELRDRVRKYIKGRKLKTPAYRYHKEERQDNLNAILKTGLNILDTQTLLYTANEETKRLIEEHGYTIITDNTIPNRPQISNLTRIKDIQKYNVVEICEDGTFKNNKPRSSRFLDIQIMADNGVITHKENQIYLDSIPKILNGSFKACYKLKK